MKKNIFLVSIMLLATFSINAQIVISQYIETNSGTKPKGIELWNTSGSTIDFSVTNLVVTLSNGNEATITSGTLLDGSVLVIGTDGDLRTETETNGANFIAKSFTFNGDDNIKVTLGGVLVDKFGDNVDPGSEWTANGVSTKNQNIQLKTGITTGDNDGWTDPSVRFELVSTDPVNDMSGFGIAPVVAAAEEVDWCNLQHPASASNIEIGQQSEDIYARVHEPGVTDATGQGANIEAWIGYGATGTNPNTWTNWVVATYNTDDGNNDEYMATISPTVNGDYDYASRFRLSGSVFTYGGYHSTGGNIWDGTTNISGTLTVEGTEVYENTEIAAANVSSLSDTEAEAVNVFAFMIEEAGDDGKATKVTNIKIKPHTTNTADWTDNIQGIKLNNGSITLGTVEITDTYINIPITAGNLDIANGASNEITMSIYLKSSGLTDNAIFSFMIDANDHGFTADAAGSQFVPEFMLDDFNSNDFTIDVEATELQFVQQPTNVVENTNISPAVTVAFTDANGNIELDLAGENISITATGATLTSSPAVVEIDVNGIAIFSALQFSTTANVVTITATGEDWDGIETIESNQFNVTEILPTLIISEYIEGDGGTNKAIELYNATNGDVNLADYALWKIENGGSWSEKDLTLSGTLAAGDVYIIANTSSVAVITDKADITETIITGFNGDDAIGLAYQGILIDAIGTETASDPGDGWDVAGVTNATADHTLVRKSSIKAGNTDWAASAGTTTENSEWIVKDANDFTYLGWHIETIWDGTTWNNGTPKPANNVLINGTFEATSGFECNNLTVNPVSSLQVPAEQTVTVNGDLINEGTILLKSQSGEMVVASGALITKGAITNNGTMTAQKYLTTPNAIPVDESSTTSNWHLVASPLNAATLVENVVADDNSTRVFEYLQADPWWSNLAKGDNIELQKGYLAQTFTDGGKNAIFTGTFQTGDVEFILSTAGDKWNLIANPYPSAIDLEQLTIDNTENTFYTFDVWAGTYLTYVKGDGGTGSRYIKSMQGFFVGTTGATKSPEEATVKFTDAARVSNSVFVDDDKKSKNKTNNLLHFTVNNNGHKYDAAIINFATEARQSAKMFSLDAEAPQVYVFENNEATTIKTYVGIDEVRIVPLAFECSLSGNYTFNTKEFSLVNDVMLHDILANKWTVIDANTSYEFTHTVGAEKHRFDIHFNSTPTGIETTENNLAQIYSHASVIYINLACAEESTITVFDLSGRKVYEKQTAAETIQINNLQEGTYLVKVTSDKGNKVEKVFVK